MRRIKKNFCCKNLHRKKRYYFNEVNFIIEISFYFLIIHQIWLNKIIATWYNSIYLLMKILFKYFIYKYEQ